MYIREVSILAPTLAVFVYGSTTGFVNRELLRQSHDRIARESARLAQRSVGTAIGGYNRSDRAAAAPATHRQTTG